MSSQKWGRLPVPAADWRLLSNPWWIVFGATMSMLVAQVPIALFTFGLFIKPLGAEFGWDRAQLSAASGVGAVFCGLAIPVIGIMMDRWGVKRVLIPLSCFSLQTSAHSR
jgi:MFS family permease